MGIALIRDLKTIRTHPRLLQHRTNDIVVMALHDHEHAGGVVFLSGENVGKIIKSADFNWEAFDDLKGSVTLYNND